MSRNNSNNNNSNNGGGVRNPQDIVAYMNSRPMSWSENSKKAFIVVERSDNFLKMVASHINLYINKACGTNSIHYVKNVLFSGDITAPNFKEDKSIQNMDRLPESERLRFWEERSGSVYLLMFLNGKHADKVLNFGNSVDNNNSSSRVSQAALKFINYNVNRSSGGNYAQTEKATTSLECSFIYSFLAGRINNSSQFNVTVKRNSHGISYAMIPISLQSILDNMGQGENVLSLDLSISRYIGKSKDGHRTPLFNLYFNGIDVADIPQEDNGSNEPSDELSAHEYSMVANSADSLL